MKNVGCKVIKSEGNKSEEFEHKVIKWVLKANIGKLLKEIKLLNNSIYLT